MNTVTKMNQRTSVSRGRRVGTGKFKEPTTVVRIPESQKAAVTDLLATYARHQQQGLFKLSLDAVEVFQLPEPSAKPVSIPLFNSKVRAGFPSPADDHVERRLNPNEYLIEQEDATYFASIQGESMVDVGLLPGDIAVVNRAKIPAIGDIVVASIDGDFTVKILSRTKAGNPRLLPANNTGQYTPIEIKEEMQFEIWGVVTGSFRRFK